MISSSEEHLSDVPGSIPRRTIVVPNARLSPSDAEVATTATPRISNMADRASPATPTLTDSSRRFDRLQFARRYLSRVPAGAEHVQVHREEGPISNYISGSTEDEDDEDDEEVRLAALDSIIHGLRHAEEQKKSILNTVTRSIIMED